MAHYDLILLGQGPSRTDCQFDAEVWATTSTLRHEGFRDKPYGKVFCFDDPNLKPDEQEGLEIARARGIPIVASFVWPHRTEEYPLREIIQHFRTNYLKNDMSYMIAMALYKGYRKLLLCGVDQGPEYIYRVGKSYVAFWLGVATGMGVSWNMSPNTIPWFYSEKVSGVA